MPQITALKSDLIHQFKHSNLSRKLLFYIVMFSSIFATLATGIQILWDFNSRVSQINSSLNYIDISFTKPLAQSLWSFDEEQLTILIHSIEDIPDIDSLKIKQIVQGKESTFYQSGESIAGSVIAQNFSLFYDETLVGELHVSASMSKVYGQLLRKSALILLIQFFKTIIVSACVLLVMYYILIRHLNFIVNYLRNTSFISGEVPKLCLPRGNNNQNDELDELASSFNGLYQKISSTMVERQRFTELLQDERDFSDTVIETMSSLLVCTDENLVIQRLNIAVEQLLLMQDEQIKGQKWPQLFTHNGDFERLNGHFLSGKQQNSTQFKMITANGHEEVIEWQCAPIYNKGKVVTYIFNGYVITPLIQAETALTALNQQLEEKIAQRTAKLSESNQTLKSALEELKLTQSDLIEAEKMASLGGLVAGVAHEINTPLGISITTASFIKEQANMMAEKFVQGKISKNGLNIFLEQLEQSIELIEANLDRAAELVSSFKQVAVDHSSEQKYCFNVRTNLEHVIKSLSHDIKQSHCTININCPDALEIDSYPSRFIQIYTNFICNSVIHGFKEWDGEKQIFINISKHLNTLKIVYKDTGCGLTPQMRSKIFEPFVTSKRGSGSSGLGAHIIYNIVTQLFAGTIQCHSELGEGVEFIIEIPITKEL
ncbi:ATP-binding protein [Pseudoalteromonas shioyasakiensis]|uniref:ATP-binding protein n=1 Tax=Pseudoalteromonas shioyasakiensis TaxID=1190813 RepID=UPI0021179435|nr:ATP-binding protein [Pseudoalteromonas shioyasakiensis]MCQ8879140.1 ATP-binding protein [Pseudoalteromonas shioyasakiensis]